MYADEKPVRGSRHQFRPEQPSRPGPPQAADTKLSGPATHQKVKLENTMGSIVPRHRSKAFPVPIPASYENMSSRVTCSLPCASLSFMSVMTKSNHLFSREEMTNGSQNGDPETPPQLQVGGDGTYLSRMPWRSPW